MAYWSPDQIMSGAGKTPSPNFGAIAGHNIATPAQKAYSPPPKTYSPNTGGGSVTVRPGYGAGSKAPSGPSGSSGRGGGSRVSGSVSSPDKVMAQQAQPPTATPAVGQAMTVEQRQAFSEAAPVKEANMSAVFDAERGVERPASTIPSGRYTDRPSNVGTSPSVKMSDVAYATPEAPDIKHVAQRSGRDDMTVKHSREGVSAVLPQSMLGGELGEKLLQKGFSEGDKSTDERVVVSLNRDSLKDWDNKPKMPVEKSVKEQKSVYVPPEQGVDIEITRGVSGRLTKAEADAMAKESFYTQQGGHTFGHTAYTEIDEGTSVQRDHKSGTTVMSDTEDFLIGFDGEVYTRENMHEIEEKK